MNRRTNWFKWGAALLLGWAGSAAAVNVLPLDTTTKGNWQGVYGSCSYVIAGSQGEPRCEIPIRDPSMGDPSCNGATCPGGPGTPLTCPLITPGSTPGPNNPNPFQQYQGGATNSLLDCSKTLVGQSGAKIKYKVRRCTAQADAAGANAQSWVWNSRDPYAWDPMGCMTNDASALQLPASCAPPNKPLGQNCTNVFPGGRVASTWDDAMELAPIGNGGGELCVDVDFSEVPDRSTAPYKLSTYMLDYDELGRMQNVLLYQCPAGPGTNCEDIGAQIAGPNLVSNFQQGAYLSWLFGPGMTLPDKVTIRVSRQQSVNAVVSGLFLDRTDSATCQVNPTIRIKKYTNGWDGDQPNGLPKDGTGPSDPSQSGMVAQVVPGGALLWTYVVTNTSAETLNNVVVNDNRAGVVVTCPQNTLAPGASMTCSAPGIAADLTGSSEGMGCGNNTAATRKTYTNTGTVTGFGAVSGIQVQASDPSAYCNPPKVKIVKFTNGHDGDTANGVPDSNPGNFSIGSGTVAQVAPNGMITWTYRVSNTGQSPLSNVIVTDNRGVAVNCPKNTLAVGESMDCTGTGVAASLLPGAPNVQGCGSGGSATRPTYTNIGSVSATDMVSGTVVQDSNPSHYCNPPPPSCNLTLNKYCEIPQAPTTDWASCKGKLQKFTLIWPANGGTINISGITNDAPGGVVQPGQKVTFTGPWSTNDLYLTVTGAASGQSTFHVSCSDADMDGRTSTNLTQQQLPGKSQDCGKNQGNGKGLSGTWVNDWLLDGLVDADGQILNCTAPVTPPTSSCSFDAQGAPECGTGGSYKPTTLTFRYTGGGCATQSHSMEPGKTSCTGAINPALPITVTLSAGGGPFTVQPGGTFTMNRAATNTTFTMSNAGGTETVVIHTSCSQPFKVGDIYYSLTLVGMDGVGAGKQVNYKYVVTNTGVSTINNITVEDNKLGFIPGSPIASLLPGASTTLSASALIDKTTTNIATAYDGQSCVMGTVTASATVTVNQPPPCTVTQDLDSISDDKIVYLLTNTGTKTITLDTLTLNFPTARGMIKEVKRGADKIYESSKSSWVVTTGVTIGSTNWTNADATKRQIKAGESKKFEIVFSAKKKATAAEFSGLATFAEGCSVSLVP